MGKFELPLGKFRLPLTVVVGDTMFVTSLSSTSAADARTGQQCWVRDHGINPGGPARLGRGVGYADGRCSAASEMVTSWPWMRAPVP